MTDKFWLQRAEEKQPSKPELTGHFAQWKATEVFRETIHRIITKHLENGTWNLPLKGN